MKIIDASGWDGYALWHKRLEVGTFQFPAVVSGIKGLEISAADLGLILSGIDLGTVRRRKRYALAKGSGI